MIANDLYQLLTLARGELARRLQRALVPWDLTTAQFYALEVIATSRGCIPSKCCAKLGMDGGAFTRILDKLEDMRLVERNRHASDRRVVQLQVLPTGVELYASTRVAVTHTQEEFLKEFHLSDANKLRRLLEQLLSDTDDHDRTGFRDTLTQAC
jgi:DNA-binding MarR family transcriptional regulator